MRKLKNRAVAEQRLRDYLVSAMQAQVNAGTMTMQEAIALQQARSTADFAYLEETYKCRTDEERLALACSVFVESMHIDALSAMNTQLKLYK